MSLADFAHWGALSFVAGAILMLVLLSGCGSMGQAKTSANALRASLHAAAPVLAAKCIDPYMGADAMTMQEAQALLKQYDRSGCSRALRTYEAARKAHEAMVATIVATEAGACTNVSRSVAKCDLLGRIGDAVGAGVALASAVQAVSQ